MTTTTISAPQHVEEPAPGQQSEEELVIVVRPKDIQLGRRGSSHRCPVALAVQRQLGCPEAIVWVSTRDVRIGDAEYRASPELDHWITRFDGGEAMHPERFVLKRVRNPFVVPSFSWSKKAWLGASNGWT